MTKGELFVDTSKLNIKLRRQVLVNTGNFTNCIAEVSLELDGVTPEEYAHKYDILGDILTCTLQLESIKTLQQQTFLNSHPHDKIIDLYKNGKSEEMEDKIVKLSQKL